MRDLGWSDDCLLGMPALDLAHKHIFDCLITAEEGLAKNDTWLAGSSMVHLGSLIQVHFAVEESLMRIFRYPEIERHIEEHREFRREVHDLVQEAVSSKGSVSRESIKVAQEWLREHIMASDRHYADYFSDSVRMSVAQIWSAK